MNTSIDDTKEVEGLHDISHKTEVHVVSLEVDDDQSIWQYLKANKRAMGWCLYVLLLMTAFGFDALLTGSLVGVPAFKRNFGYFDEKAGIYIISALWQSLWTAGTAIMMMFGALAAGQLHARLGIQKTIAISLIFTVSGIITQQLSRTPAHFLGAKLIAGTGYGLQTATGIMSIGSYAPSRVRGTLGACLNTFILFGGWLAQGTLTGTGQTYLTSSLAYQIPFALEYLWVVIMLAGLYWVPEAASWHLRRGEPEKAKAALTRTHGPTRMDIVQKEYDLAVYSHELDMATTAGQANVGFLEPLKKGNIQRTLIAAGCLGFQQLVGASFVTSYLTYFFQVAGAAEKLSLTLGQVSFTVQVIGNLVSWWSIEKLGRRRSLVGGLASMTVVLVIIGITWAARSAASLWVMVVFMTIWAFIYQMTIGACGYSVAAEIPSSRLRSATIGMAQATAQVASWGMGFATPYMINPDEGNLGGYVGFVFAGICGAATVWAFFSIPETAGRTLAEIDQLFSERVPVRQWRGRKVEPQHLETEVPAVNMV